MDKLYKYEKDQRGVVTITLNRPEIHNAFNDELINQLTEIFSMMNTDPSVRLVVITGEGKSFCAGADLTWMKKMVDFSEEENYKDSLGLAMLFKTLNDFTKPLIGKINGAALGGGAGLVAICDYVLASDNAKFGFTEVRLGIIPAVISPYVVAKIGETNARATFLSGMRFCTRDARRMGLIHRRVDHEKLDEETNRIVGEFLLAGPKAAIGAKKLIRDVIHFGTNQKESIESTCRSIAKFRISKEGQEGMNAILEKKSPSWVEKK
jgi:methylglutaconyl-CoA hydratase